MIIAVRGGRVLFYSQMTCYGFNWATPEAIAKGGYTVSIPTQSGHLFRRLDVPR